MKYFVKTNCLEWHHIGYVVEANSEEEAKDLVENGEGDILFDNYDITDEINIENVEEYED